MSFDDKKQVGKVIRVEWDQETDEVRLIMEITDDWFKKKVIHSKDFQDILSLRGKDVMVSGSKE